ncbi:MAG: ChaN family lipoprotein [Kofleriaceae bacterium]
MQLHRAFAALACLALGCGGRYGGTARAPTPAAKAPAGGLAAAALPYAIVDARTGRAVDESAFWARVGSARAVCVGEDHTNPHHHWVQLSVVQHLVKHLPKGTRIALGMEMFQRPFQGVLEDYASKRIDAAALRSRAGWEERWGYDWGFYAETIDAAVAAGAHLLALNASRELTKKVVRKGLESLTPEEKAQVPELVLDDQGHRAWFDALMDSMGGTDAHSTKAPDVPDDDVHKDVKPAPAPPPAAEMPSAERIYTVQVIWDESMADGAAKWLAATPSGHAVILAGNGHCHDTAIVNRLKRRGITDVISVRPVVDVDGQVAESLAKPMNDFIVVLTMPPDAKAAAEAPAAEAPAADSTHAP